MCPPGGFDATPPSAHDALARRHRRRLGEGLGGQRPAAKAGPGAPQTPTRTDSDSEAPLAGGAPGPGPWPWPSARRAQGATIVGGPRRGAARSLSRSIRLPQPEMPPRPAATRARAAPGPQQPSTPRAPTTGSGANGTPQRTRSPPQSPPGLPCPLRSGRGLGPLCNNREYLHPAGLPRDHRNPGGLTRALLSRYQPRGSESLQAQAFRVTGCSFAGYRERLCHREMASLSTV